MMSSPRLSILQILITILFISATNGCKNATDSAIESNSQSVETKYNPVYWLEGVLDHRNPVNDSNLKIKMKEIRNQGWGGVLYWGASREGEKMSYFFESTYLSKQNWAHNKDPGFSSIIKNAHENGLKVMINIEGVNPYHWEAFKWTPENISLVGEELANSGVDAVFEECFEVQPDIFLSLARTLRKNNVDYISGTDPMLLREANFVKLWPETGIIDIYNYYIKRDKRYNIATLTQHGSLGYGWAKYWNKPTSMISPLTRNWGISMEYSPAVVSYISMIRALQFRLDNIIIFGGQELFNPIENKRWLREYVSAQEKNRPVMNVVVLLEQEKEYSGSETGNIAWNRLFNSGDAITSGAFNAGYDIVVSDKVVPADAYWIYAKGGEGDRLPEDVVSLFSTEKPVFLQAGSNIPSGGTIANSWKKALSRCGVDGNVPFSYGTGSTETISSLPPSQEEEIPYTGYYKDTYLRFTGTDVQRGLDLRAGTVIPEKAISGEALATPNSTYGKGPFIVGSNNKYLVTPTALNWEVAYPISDLLSGYGISPESNVWGIAGEKVTALLAIETTELEIHIPNLKNGSKINVVIWDKFKRKKSEETLIYTAPYRHYLKEYDFILIKKEKS
ncbi:MAG: hypothetical protein ACFHWX_15320 [Bacteroidota bacterium]